jgi:hypothetical protein
MAEITRLGFTMEQVNILFKTKGEQLKAYDGIFKASFWTVFKDYLWNVPGMTTGFEAEVNKFIMTHGDLGKMYDQLEAMLRGKLTGATQHHWATLRYDFSMSVFESIRTTFEVKEGDLKTIMVKAPEAGLTGTFTYVERQILLLNMQMQIKLITYEVYVKEITRLGYTVEKVNTLMTTKGSALSKFEMIMKEKVWSYFSSYLWNIPGFTAALEGEVKNLVMTNGDMRSLFTKIETFLTSKLEFSQTILVTLRYDFNMSIFEGIRDVFEIKKSDTNEAIIVPAPVVEVPKNATNSTNTTEIVETEFTIIERQVMYFYIEFTFQIITQQEYYHSITKLGYNFESVKEIVETKKTQL